MPGAVPGRGAFLPRGAHVPGKADLKRELVCEFAGLESVVGEMASPRLP